MQFPYMYIMVATSNSSITIALFHSKLGPGDLGSISGRVIPKTLKMVLDTSLLKTQQYTVCIKGKSEAIQGKE